MPTSTLRPRNPHRSSSSSLENSDQDEESLTKPPTIHNLLKEEDNPSTHLSLVDILRVLGGLCIVVGLFSYFVTGKDFSFGRFDGRVWWLRGGRWKAWWNYPLLLPPSTLKLYNGTSPNLPIYLALNSTIYDVSSSPHLYGPGGGYHFFAGRDATRAFVTGCFDEGGEEQFVGDLRAVEEMFIPLEDEDDDDDRENENSAKAKDGVKGKGKAGREPSKEERRAQKLKREQERRKARKQVEETVRGWEKMYKENKEGKYWAVGRVLWGEEGEERKEREEGPPPLCRRAREGRPRRKKQEKGGGD